MVRDVKWLISTLKSSYEVALPASCEFPSPKCEGITELRISGNTFWQFTEESEGKTVLVNVHRIASMERGRVHPS